MTYEQQKLIFDQYAAGTIHVFEMMERFLSAITPEDLRQHFLVDPVEFERKLGLDPEPVDEELIKRTAEEYAALLRSPAAFHEARRKKEMQTYAAGLFTLAAGLLAESFDGFVPSILSTADGRIVVVEQDVHHEAHRLNPKTLPTITHVIG